MTRDEVKDLLRTLLFEKGDPSIVATDAPEAQLLAAMAVCSRAGLSARLLRIRKGEARSLSLPTVVLLDGVMTILADVGPRGLRLLTRDSETTLSAAALEAHAPRVGLEVCGSPLLRSLTPRAVLDHVLGERGFVARVLVTAGVPAGIAVALPWLSAFALDYPIRGGARHLLLAVALAIVITALHVEYFGWLRDRALLDLSASLERALAHAVFDATLEQPLVTNLRQSTGDRLELLQSARVVSETLASRVLTPAVDALAGTAAVVFLLWFDPVLLSFVAVAAVSIALGLALSSRRIWAHESRAIDFGARHGASLLNLVRGVDTLRAHGAEAFAARRWRAVFRELLAAKLRLRGISIDAGLVQDAITGLAFVVTVYWLGRGALTGTLSVGLLVAETQAAMSVLAIGAHVGRAFHAAQEGMPHYERIQALLSSRPPPSLARAVTRARQENQGAALVLSGIWFRYGPEQPWVLRDYGLTLEPGGFHELRGYSGSGKTTTLRIIAGLCSPERGVVQVGGLDAATARALIAYVPQVPQLLGGTVLYNLEKLSGGASATSIRAACERTGLADVLRSVPAGLHAQVGPGGSLMSGGQRQLIALTAALASDRPILLLDEATAHLDPITRGKLNADLFATKTVVFATHV